MNTIISHYQTALKNQELSPNPSQEDAVTVLDRAYREHTEQVDTPYQGVYLWGEVGRGKTLLMDLFYNNLATERKQRLHFQEFMRYIHAQLHEYQGKKNPLTKIAADLSKHIDVLCLDELLVEDVADAMILASLFKELLARKLFVVMTANLAPNQLYSKGTQREKFLPAIELLQEHLYIVHIQNSEDYRRQQEIIYPTYLFPDSKEVDNQMENLFLHYAKPPYDENITVDVNDHILAIKKKSHEVLWCDFHALCGTAHSAQDYLTLTQAFRVLLVSHVPLLDQYQENEARRLMSLVDVCYDQRVLLIISAAVPLLELYQGKLLQHGFQRTVSRLWEMQTDQYK